MADPMIAPETQRLAEANNVEWRALAGSGAGGEVLERDVLGYLTRVMLGEEATDPTPEPLPEGLSAWPEEPTRQGRADDLFAASLSAAAVTSAVTEPEPSPWRLDATEVPPATEEVEDKSGFIFVVNEPEAAPEAVDEAPFSGWGLAESATPEPQGAADLEPTKPEASNAAAPLETPTRQTGVSQAGASQAGAPEPAQLGVSEALYGEALREIETLRARLAAMEEERLRHVSELHQLSRMQETIALQKDQGSRLSAAQSELQRLKAELAVARGEAQHAAVLEAKNHDLEERLNRARTFRTNAKAEYERLLADNMMLEHETAELRKRRSLKLWGK